MTADLADLAQALKTEFRRQRPISIAGASVEAVTLHGTFDLLALAPVASRAHPDPAWPRRELATIAARQATLGLGELLAFAANGDETLTEVGGGECTMLLLDAAKIAIEIVTAEASDRGEAPDEDRNQVLGALARYLEGWA